LGRIFPRSFLWHLQSWMENLVGDARGSVLMQGMLDKIDAETASEATKTRFRNMAILMGLQILDFEGLCAGASRSTVRSLMSPVKWSLNQREPLALQSRADEELRESQRLLRELTTQNDNLRSEITRLRAEVDRNAELRHEYGRIAGEMEDLER
jgi:hypothetical protein